MYVQQALYYWEEAQTTKGLYVHTDQPGDTSLTVEKNGAVCVPDVHLW